MTTLEIILITLVVADMVYLYFLIRSMIKDVTELIDAFIGFFFT